MRLPFGWGPRCGSSWLLIITTPEICRAVNGKQRGLQNCRERPTKIALMQGWCFEQLGQDLQNVGPDSRSQPCWSPYEPGPVALSIKSLKRKDCCCIGSLLHMKMCQLILLWWIFASLSWRAFGSKWRPSRKRRRWQFQLSWCLEIIQQLPHGMKTSICTWLKFLGLERQLCFTQPIPILTSPWMLPPHLVNHPWAGLVPLKPDVGY